MIVVYEQDQVIVDGKPESVSIRSGGDRVVIVYKSKSTARVK